MFKQIINSDLSNEGLQKYSQQCMFEHLNFLFLSLCQNKRDRKRNEEVQMGSSMIQIFLREKVIPELS